MRFKIATLVCLFASMVNFGLVSQVHAAVPPAPSDKVTVERVTFKNRILIDLVGDLYLPKDIDRSKKYRAIVVGPPFGSVKEQTSGLHAQKLAEMGYVALAFDPSFRGESGGMPRQIDVPEIRVEDFSAAVDFLSNHPLVDKDRIGVLGVCASGSYGISAAQIDHRIKAFATVSMYDIGRARREGLGGTVTYERRMQTLKEVGEQRTREFAGAQRRDINSIATQLTGQETEIQREFYEYYRTPRGGHPRATNSYSFTSMAPLTNFFPLAQIETISPRPVLFIVGERAESAYFSEDAYSKAAEPKELFVVPGASHVDLYDIP
ncbi:MAG: alpha/beta hydrolase, partial [Sporomusa sp.]